VELGVHRKIRKTKEVIVGREHQNVKAAGTEPGPIDPKTQYNFRDPVSWIVPD
jgi:hypothetical protein